MRCKIEVRLICLMFRYKLQLLSWQLYVIVIQSHQWLNLLYSFNSSWVFIEQWCNQRVWWLTLINSYESCASYLHSFRLPHLSWFIEHDCGIGVDRGILVDILQVFSSVSCKRYHPISSCEYLSILFEIDFFFFFTVGLVFGCVPRRYPKAHILWVWMMLSTLELERIKRALQIS